MPLELSLGALYMVAGGCGRRRAGAALSVPRSRCRSRWPCNGKAIALAAKVPDPRGPRWLEPVLSDIEFGQINLLLMRWSCWNAWSSAALARG